MNLDSFHFKVGTFDCIAISDGTLTYTDPADLHFVTAPADRLAQALRTYNIDLDQWKEWISPLTSLVIQTGKHCVLVDTGLGHIDFGPNAGKLLKNLHEEGIEAGDIDTVILSHAHGDHIGGNTNSEGRAAFPHARYIMHKAEWDFWTSETTLAHPDYNWMTFFVEKQLSPIADRFDLLEQDAEIVPGVRTLLAPGHTPGNIVISIKSEGEQLLYLGDVFAHPIHLEEPGWHLAPDCQPELSIRTRRWLFDLAATEQALVMAFHVDFPGLGYIQKQKDAWKWQPIAMRSGE